MARASVVFVVACMALICASFGAVLYLMFGLSATEALLVAIAALTGIAVCTIAATGGGRRAATPTQIVDLSRGVADLARQVVELGRRVAAMEGKVAHAVERAAAAEPCMAEIGEISVLIKQLAESVSAHELVLQNSTASRSTAAASVAPATSPPGPGVGATAARQSLSHPVEHKPATARPREVSPVREAAGDIDMGGAPAGVAKAGSVPNSGVGFKGLTVEAATAVIREAIDANRLEFFLQPIVTLPQRKVRFYEALARLRTAEGELLAASDFIDTAEAAGLMPRIDNQMLLRCVQVARRLMAKSRDVGLFCNLSASTLVDPAFFPQLTAFTEANRAIAPALVFEFTQAAYRTMGPLESESLVALMGWGFRFSMDHVGDLKFEPRNLADRGFRFIKVPATLLLNRHSGGAADIHAADLSGLLTRFGIELIAERIESEGTVVDLLDYEVALGQGYLFSPPRPVRADLLRQDAAASAPGKAAEQPLSREAERIGATLTPSPKVIDPRLSALQRPTALSQIARAVAAREPVVRDQRSSFR
jgi:cyclic-di-GMP phosphodiesterase TipF (flagellum assembly factor)